MCTHTDNLILLIMAAGKGNRYGGLKQLEPIGPKGETLAEYAIFDAMRAGFKKVVFVIQPGARELFEKVERALENHIEVAFANQEILSRRPGATADKPLGTGHAVLCARSSIDKPFAVINADDFYGANSFRIIAKFLSTSSNTHPCRFGIVGFRIRNTLSFHGPVSRSILEMNSSGQLLSINEVEKIYVGESRPYFFDVHGNIVKLIGNELVSMNMWGLTPTVFDHLEAGFAHFMRQAEADAVKEFYLPAAMSSLITNGQANIEVLKTEEEWKGITYQDDKKQVVQHIEELVKKERYPAPLWFQKRDVNEH